MEFCAQHPTDYILAEVGKKIDAMRDTAPLGFVIVIEKRKKQRTNRQNRFLRQIFTNIVEFWQESGFMPDDLKLKFINSAFLDEYFKVRFDVKHTSALSTLEFYNYCESIQLLMEQQSKGNYTRLVPEELYFKTHEHEV